MKRFYKTVTVEPEAGGHGVRLDGRAMRTPAKQHLVIPSRQVAEAVAEEWRAQGEDIDPTSMPMLRLANTAVDIVAPQREAVIDNLAAYGDSDLLFYFADRPADLRQAQEAAWRPVLEWAEARFSVTFSTGTGISFVQQDPVVPSALRQAVGEHDDMCLAALNDLVSISGSLLLALALSHDALDIDALWQAARVDEAHQAGRWGWDAEAARVAERRRGELECAARFIALHREGAG